MIPDYYVLCTLTIRKTQFAYHKAFALFLCSLRSVSQGHASTFVQAQVDGDFEILEYKKSTCSIGTDCSAVPP